MSEERQLPLPLIQRKVETEETFKPCCVISKTLHQTKPRDNSSKDVSSDPTEVVLWINFSVVGLIRIARKQTRQIRHLLIFAKANQVQYAKYHFIERTCRAKTGVEMCFMRLSSCFAAHRSFYAWTCAILITLSAEAPQTN